MMSTRELRAGWMDTGTDLSGFNERLGTDGVGDMLAAAGLDWEVEAIPDFAQSTGGYTNTGKFVTVRNDKPEIDPGRYLGTVGRRYKVVQNREVAELAGSIVEAGMGAGKNVTVDRGGEQVRGDHPALSGTAYGLLNATMQHNDHDRKFRAVGSRMNSFLGGTTRMFAERSGIVLANMLEAEGVAVLN